MTEPTNADIAKALRSIPGLDLGTELLVRLAADRLDPKACVDPDADMGWIEWKGGECPVPKDWSVLVELNGGGTLGPQRAETFNWNHIFTLSNIVRYRVIK